MKKGKEAKVKKSASQLDRKKSSSFRMKLYTPTQSPKRLSTVNSDKHSFEKLIEGINVDD